MVKVTKCCGAWPRWPSWSALGNYFGTINIPSCPACGRESAELVHVAEWEASQVKSEDRPPYVVGKRGDVKVKSVIYSALFSLGRYQNEKIGLTADVEETDTPEAVVEALRAKAYALAHKESELEDMHRQYNELRRLNDMINTAREDWGRSRDFLIAQGLRPEAPEFPVPARKAIPPMTEHTEFVGEGEE